MLPLNLRSIPGLLTAVAMIPHVSPGTMATFPLGACIPPPANVFAIVHCSYVALYPSAVVACPPDGISFASAGLEKPRRAAVSWTAGQMPLASSLSGTKNDRREACAQQWLEHNDQRNRGSPRQNRLARYQPMLVVHRQHRLVLKN